MKQGNEGFVRTPVVWWWSRCPAGVCTPVPGGISSFHDSCTNNSQSGGDKGVIPVIIDIFKQTQ